jgi:hypothetical protein
MQNDSQILKHYKNKLFHFGNKINNKWVKQQMVHRKTCLPRQGL